jgi:putative transposase
MTARLSVDPADFLHEHLTQASSDLMRQMLTTFINTLLSADADAANGAAWGQVSDTRITQRNGYRHRDLETRTGTATPGGA